MWFVPTPATTVHRSPTAAMTARRISPSSATEVVGASPVVPLTTMPSLPCSTRWVATLATPSRSTPPFGGERRDHRGQHPAERAQQAGSCASRLSIAGPARGQAVATERSAYIPRHERQREPSPIPTSRRTSRTASSRPAPGEPHGEPPGRRSGQAHGQPQYGPAARYDQQYGQRVRAAAVRPAAVRPAAVRARSPAGDRRVHAGAPRPGVRPLRLRAAAPDGPRRAAQG